MTNEQAIAKAESRLSLCNYHSEVQDNAGLRAAYSNEAEWLSVVLNLAKKTAQAGEGERNAHST